MIAAAAKWLPLRFFLDTYFAKVIFDADLQRQRPTRGAKPTCPQGFFYYSLLV
jgi:hypothetical protein